MLIEAQSVISYCNEIEETIGQFGEDYEVFKKDSVYRNAVALCMLQIGELTGSLTDDYVNKNRRTNPERPVLLIS